MKQVNEITRRQFVGRTAALAAAGMTPWNRVWREMLPTRPIPATGELLPVVGFGSTKAVLEIPAEGVAPIANVIDVLREYGGRVVDTSPRSAEIDRQFGAVLQSAEAAEPLFIAAKIYVEGEAEGVRQMRQNQELFGRRTLDLVQVESLRDLNVHWPNVRRWKEAGEARYFGATVFLDRDHDALEAFMRREAADFVHLNYSVAETEAETCCPWPPTGGWRSSSTGPS